MKNFLATVFSIVFCITLYAQDTLRLGNKISKNLELEFNEEAIESEAFITWVLTGDWNDFDFSFNQGTQKDGRYTIKANEYKSLTEAVEGIDLVIMPHRKRTTEKDYSLSMQVYEVSDALVFQKGELDMDLSFFVLMPPPTPWWLKLIRILIIALLIFIVLWFAFLKKIFYPKMSGILQFDDGSIIRFNNCYKFILYTSSLKPKYAKETILSYILIGKKACFQMPYPDAHRSNNKYIIIKPIKRRRRYYNKLDKINNIEFLSLNKTLFHREEYSFKDADDNMKITFVYDNMKHGM